MGSLEVPLMPSCAAMSVVKAKNVSVWARLRLKLQRRELVVLAPRVWLQLRTSLQARLSMASWNPKSCSEPALRSEILKLLSMRSFLVRL